MSTRKKSDPADPGSKPAGRHSAVQRETDRGFVVTPLLGALLRVTHEELTQTILRELRKQGIEISETEFGVLRYPGPDGARPTDLAQRCGMTKQAMNYVLAGLESKGYLERSGSPGRRARAVVLTRKGWGLLAAMRRCATGIEKQWARHIGAPRFNAARATLLELAVWLGKIDSPVK